MDEQQCFFEGNADSLPKKCCAKCRFCAEFKKPYERSDGASIYGYCFKSGDKDYSPNMGKGYPIWLPLDCGAACREFKRRGNDG